MAPLAACASPNDVMVQLQPEVISSLDGNLQVHALVLSDRDPIGKGKAIELAIEYTDRNGTAHAIASQNGTTDSRGAFDATFTGLGWDGTGKVTATVTGGTTVTGDAFFSVLDRSPPKLTIAQPTGNVVHINSGSTVTVHVTDEIGLSSVTLQASADSNGGGGGGRQRTAIFSGATDEMIAFDFGQFQNSTAGQTITFYALAADLSGNLGVATPIMVTVAP